jgi:hypothetical protein
MGYFRKLGKLMANCSDLHRLREGITILYLRMNSSQIQNCGSKKFTLDKLFWHFYIGSQLYLEDKLKYR